MPKKRKYKVIKVLGPYRTDSGSWYITVENSQGTRTTKNFSSQVKARTYKTDLQQEIKINEAADIERSIDEIPPYEDSIEWYNKLLGYTTHKYMITMDKKFKEAAQLAAKALEVKVKAHDITEMKNRIIALEQITQKVITGRKHGGGSIR